MEWNEFENFLACERERRKTPREREIEHELTTIAAKHAAACAAESAPLYQELKDIEIRKPPLPIWLNGKIFEYAGPDQHR